MKVDIHSVSDKKKKEEYQVKIKGYETKISEIRKELLMGKSKESSTSTGSLIEGSQVSFSLLIFLCLFR
jgi:hypothetical protein